MKTSTVKALCQCMLTGVLLAQIAACKKPAEIKLMYVGAKDGLNVREQPAPTGKLLKTIPFGDMVRVFEEKGEPITIDKITGKWTRIECRSLGSVSCNGWVFGGFLAEHRNAAMDAAVSSRAEARKLAEAPACHEKCDSELDRQKETCAKDKAECERTSDYCAGSHLSCPFDAEDEAKKCHEGCD